MKRISSNAGFWPGTRTSSSAMSAKREEFVLRAYKSRADADEDVRVPGICDPLLKMCHDLSVDPLDD